MVRESNESKSSLTGHEAEESRRWRGVAQPLSATMLALLLLLAAKGAAAQGPGNGISKSTWAASDPIHTSYPWLCARLLRRTFWLLLGMLRLFVERNAFLMAPLPAG